jgi:putative membrane protein
MMAVFHFQRIERVSDRGRGLSPLVVRILVTGVAVFLAVTIVPGIESSTFAAGVGAVLVLTLLNAVIRPILYLISFPLIVLSLGLFLVVINALLLQLTAYFVKGFTVSGFWASVGGALVISIVTSMLNLWAGTDHVRIHEQAASPRPPKIINPD